MDTRKGGINAGEGELRAHYWLFMNAQLTILTSLALLDPTQARFELGVSLKDILDTTPTNLYVHTL